MLTVLWRPSARRDLTAILRFIAKKNPIAAKRMRTILEDALVPVAQHPHLFRPGRVAGTREIVAHPNYIIVYRVSAEGIDVVNVVHARTQYPPSS